MTCPVLMLTGAGKSLSAAVHFAKSGHAWKDPHGKADLVRAPLFTLTEPHPLSPHELSPTGTYRTCDGELHAAKHSVQPLYSEGAVAAALTP